MFTTKKLQLGFLALATLSAIKILSYISICCDELQKECLACQRNLTVLEFCREYSGTHGCPFNVLLAISLDNTNGRTKFAASVLKNYLKVDERNLVVLNDEISNYNNIKSFFGSNVKVAKTIANALNIFVTSAHDILLIISSDVILHKSWKVFLGELFRRSSEASIYRLFSAEQRFRSAHTRFETIALNKTVAKTLLKIDGFPMRKSLLAAALKFGYRIFTRTNLPLLRLDRRSDGGFHCISASTTSHIQPCDFPSWVKEGIQFYQNNCTTIDAEYVAKDGLPRMRIKGNTRIGILLESTSLASTKSFIRSLKKTSETDFNYTLYVAINSGAQPDKATEDLLGDISLKVFSKHNRSTIDIVNELYNHAYQDKMDYFVQTVDMLLLRSSTWSSNAVLLMTSLRPPNMGVIQTTCSDCGAVWCMNFVSRFHFDIFGSFYPAGISNSERCEWINEVYKADSQWEVKFQGEPAERSSWNNLSHAISRGRQIISTWSRPVVAYSLYGSDVRYTGGAIANMHLMQKYFPEWQMWVYHDNSVPDEILKQLCKNGVTLIDMTNFPMRSRMGWRFAVASEPVPRYIIRDVDSRLSKRDRSTVDEWIESGKKFHIIRDHYEHVKYPMCGGMWGGTFDAFPEMTKLMLEKDFSTFYMADMYFLAKVVWKEAQKSVLQHDETRYSEFGDTVSFPLPPENSEYIGEVFYDGQYE